jgi:RNA polymerase sigma-70 factor (ECF subfamily)
MKRSADAIISLSEIEATLPDYSIAQGIEDEELAKLISAFLWSEKELDRNVFLRKYWFFDSISDIAERYSMRENTVKSMLFRTRNRLREFLRKEGIEV